MAIHSSTIAWKITWINATRTNNILNTRLTWSQSALLISTHPIPPAPISIFQSLNANLLWLHSEGFQRTIGPGVEEVNLMPPRRELRGQIRIQEVAERGLPEHHFSLAPFTVSCLGCCMVCNAVFIFLFIVCLSH